MEESGLDSYDDSELEDGLDEKYDGSEMFKWLTSVNVSYHRR